MNKKDSLPPYGLLNDHFLAVVSEHPLFPNDWIGVPGCQDSLLDQWERWREETLEIIASTIWPRYNSETGWQGASKQFMVPLTEVDLALIDQLRPLSDTALNPTTSLTHRQLFEQEDNTQMNPFGSSYSAYDPTLPFRLTEKIQRTMQWSLASKAGTAAVQIKRVLQRPRAYQVSLIWERTGFSHLAAISADSPSICSGHCYEGMMMVAGVMERFLVDNEDLTLANWLALKQYAVDIGDRRCMAGVHHPSDNLASWLMVMRISRHVFRDNRVKTKLWDAIEHQSKVYGAILDAVKNGTGGVYLRALDALRKAAQ